MKKASARGQPWHKWIRRHPLLIVALFFLICAVATGFAVAQQLLQALNLWDEQYRIVYVLFSLAAAPVLIDRFRHHKNEVDTARLEDPSYVRSILQQAKEYRIKPTSKRSKKSVKCLSREIRRLKEIGKCRWTEYEILPLEKSLSYHYSDSELISRSTDKLNELNEYAQDSHYRYDMEQYYKWEAKIEYLIERLTSLNEEIPEEKKSKAKKKKKSREKRWARKQLIAAYRSLLEHISSYKQDWNEGSTVIKNLLICTITSVILFLTMGLIPLLYPVHPSNLDIIHWGLLGSAGALTAVARDFRRSDLIAVGNTYGKKELWRAILGAVLGFIAGLILWAMLKSNLLPNGGLFPDFASNNTKMQSDNLQQVALSVFWAVVAGFSFDRIFDQVKAHGDSAFR